MLIACHLFFGTGAGLLLREKFKIEYLLPICILGSILPDIIDKPLGYLIFPQIGDGRLIAHSLLGLIIIILITGLIFRSVLMAGAIGLGVMMHQILDGMWNIPVNWFYPILGPFPVFPQTDYFAWGFMRELTTPSEYLFAAGILLLLMGRSSEPARIRVAILTGAPALLLLITGR